MFATTAMSDRVPRLPAPAPNCREGGKRLQYLLTNTLCIEFLRRRRADAAFAHDASEQVVLTPEHVVLTY